jgi:DNA-directed RNA polymerase specialized sigma24 family protein
MAEQESLNLAELDEDRFRELVKPYMDTLLRAAGEALEFYQLQGVVREGDLTPEDVTGEALIHAWDLRARRPGGMSLRGWLLGVQHRALIGLVERHRVYQEDMAISLDAEAAPMNAGDAPQEWFWDWFQPDEELTLEDITPAYDPVDFDLVLDQEERDVLRDMDDTSRHVLLMHDRYDMSLPEVAFTMQESLNDLSRVLERARATLRERTGGGQDIRETDHPAPPAGSDT